MMEISCNENKESGFLVLHTKESEKIISDIVVGKHTNSLIGVTLLEIYVGFRQNRSLYRAYKHEKEGKLEVIHSYTPMLQEIEILANPWIPPSATQIMSSADVSAAERFDVMVSVIESDGKVESSSKKRKKELEEIISDIVPEECEDEQ
jgi:hypothetical protein